MTDVLEQRFLLPEDATLAPVTELTPRFRAALDPHGDGQVVLSRPRNRMVSQLVTAELATLLGEFRRPSRIVDAVVRYSRAQDRDPHATLEDAFDALAQFIHGGVLVPADSLSAEPIVPTLAPGQGFAGYEIVDRVSALADTEVYRAVTVSGLDVALKLGRPDTPEGVAGTLAAEARMLEHLGGHHVPRIVDHGAHATRAFLAMEWRSGTPVSAAAHQLRAPGDGRRRLHALGVEVLSAYAWLHQRDVLHGDIHPGNILVGPAGTVTLLDFGRSRRLGSVVDGTAASRAGVAQFYEPELAEALRSGSTPPVASAAGEQYALAALLHHLMTGSHYVEFSPEHDVLIEQVIGQSPLPFAARGLPPWPAAEQALARALAKDPACRFPDLAAFRDAFRHAPPAARRRAPAPQAAARMVREFVAHAAFDSGAAPSPDGARDLAWFALRAALSRGDPDLLASADVWSVRAAAGRPADPPRASIAAAIHRARGDGAAEADALATLLRACEAGSRCDDLLGGRSGAIDAAARRLGGADAGHALAAWVRRTIEEIWDPAPNMAVPGLAHGLAGVLYATLGACRQTSMPLPRAGAEHLAEQARVVRMPATSGWCRGSAGTVLLWLRAHEQAADRRYLDLALSAGEHVRRRPTGRPDLCCGDTGRGFALLALHRATGLPEWLRAARRIAAEAAAGWSSGAAPFSLRKGPLGTALLLMELERPEAAVTPIVT